MCHAEGPRVHSEKKNTLGALTKAVEIFTVTIPGILQRVVGMRHGSRKFKGAEIPAEPCSSLDKGRHEIETGRSGEEVERR